jgi:hypothetical protein
MDTVDNIGPVMDVQDFFIKFQDHLAPRLDTYEQAIYLYLVRHSRLIGLEEVTIGFKSARKRIACGIGVHGKPMSEGTAYDKLQSLATKGCLEMIRTQTTGKQIRVLLPDEMPGVIPGPSEAGSIDPEALDFFDIRENRVLVLERENHHCFYCLRRIDGANYVIEHVVSRPSGNNNYRNTVAACRDCNNRKGSSLAEDFLRDLYRGALLRREESEGRLSSLRMLQAGELKPDFTRAVPCSKEAEAELQ